MTPKRGARAANVPRVDAQESFVHVMVDMYYDASRARDESDFAPIDEKWGDKAYEAMRTKESRNKIIKEGGNYLQPAMRGWVQDFADAIEDFAKIEVFDEKAIDQLSEIMDTYTPSQVPVLSGLARHYAVSDM